MNRKVSDIVEAAIKEYNTTMFGRNSHNLLRTTPLEKRGLLYNALRRQFQYGWSSFDFPRKVAVHNLRCAFREDGSIVSFTIERNTYYWSQKTDEDKIIDEINSHGGAIHLNPIVNVNFDDIKDFKFNF